MKVKLPVSIKDLLRLPRKKEEILIFLSKGGYINLNDVSQRKSMTSSNFVNPIAYRFGISK